MKDNFRGWNTVFAFTFRQSTKGIAYKLVTALITLIILGLFILFNILVAKPDKDKNAEPSPIKKVIILDESGFSATDYKSANPALNEEQFHHIEFLTITGKTRKETISTAAEDSAETIAVIISPKDAGYEMEAVIPSGSGINKGEAEKLLEQMLAAFNTNKLMQAGLNQDQLAVIFKPVITSYAEVGENTNEIVFVIKLLAPMIFGMLLFLMLQLYGQNISKSVSTEKTSKLMETLLTSVHPYALISGKILATVSMAILQFVTWIIAGAVGLYGGNAIAHALYPEYQNSVITILNFLKDNIGETAMSIPAVILAIFFFCIGFLFYCIIAGLAGCIVSKPEDVATTQSLSMFPIIISWMIAYFAPAIRNETLTTFVRYFPFTSPFSVPVDLLTGAMGLIEGIISTLILSVFCFIVIILSARIYKGLLLYNGQKINMKLIGNILKTNK